MDHFQHEPAAVTGEVVSSVPRSEPPPARVGVPVVGRLPLALAAGATLLIACISMVGAARPGIYARETPNWAAQAVGQDWMDLLVAVPWLTITARASARGSRRGLLLLAAGLAYAVYALVLYAFAVHFNALFLLYCAALGLSLGSLLGVLLALLRSNVAGWFAQATPVRGAGIFLVAVGVCFLLLWLSEIVPALARGTIPPSIVQAGVPTNPVHVLDLSLVLPAHIAGGLLALRRHPLGFLAAPILLGFGVLMAASIGGMMVVMSLRGVAADLSVALLMTGLSIAAGVLVTRMLRCVREPS